jgi:hypothetical protein
MMNNIFISTDPVGNIKPEREKSTESVYDKRGLLVV